MQRLLVFSSLLFVTLGLSLTLHAGEQPKRQPVPDKKALTKAKDLVDDIFKEDLAKAKDAEARTKLAAYLVQQGDESGEDPAARYVLYLQGRDLAVLAGNPGLALGTVDKLALYYDVPALELKAEAMAKLVEQVATKEPSKALTDLALGLIAEALDADNYDSAVAFGKVATAAAKRAQVVPLVAAVEKRNGEIEAAKGKFSVLQPFVDRLKKDPGDAEANLKIGEYFGLFKGKWERAIPLLAKSKSEPLAGLAVRDLAEPKDAKEQLALADAWWDFAAKQPQPQQARLQERAGFWYEKALSFLSGLSRTKAQKRLDLVAASSQGARPPADGPVGFLKLLEGHTGEIRALAISSDGRLGLSGSVDNTMRLWDLATCKEVQSFKGHNKQVWGVAFMPGNREVLSASWDGTAKVWDVANGTSTRSFTHPLDVNAVVVSRDGKWMLTACDDKRMRLWDLNRNEQVKNFAPHGNFCYACAFAPSGNYVASGGADRRVMVFELATDKVVREVEQANPVLALAFSPDGRFLFTCGDNAVHMWDIATGKEERKFAAASGLTTAMALTPDGKRLATGGEDKVLRIWNVATAKEVTHFTGHSAAISAVAVSSDGTRALSGSTDGTIRYWGLPGQ